MKIETFDDLLTSARQQTHAQRLLFVFATSELPDESTFEQRQRYQAGLGGALVPMMEVDKLPEDLKSFDQLIDESTYFAQGTPAADWTIVFCAAIGGEGKRPPSSEDADLPLRQMAQAIRMGEIRPYITFDRMGHLVKLIKN